MEIVMRSVAEIRPYERNPRLNDDAVSAVAESIRRFGFRQPIVVDADGRIVCGHTRWKAARKLGLDRVPVHIVRDLTPEQIRAYRIADNKTPELATWNLGLLSEEMNALQGIDLDWSELGFNEMELAELLGSDVAGLTDPDAIPESRDEGNTRRGDLWLLRGEDGAEHRLLCGDAGRDEDIIRLLDGAAPALEIRDPPFDADYSRWPLRGDPALIFGRGKQIHLFLAALIQNGWRIVADTVSVWRCVGGLRIQPVAIHHTAYLMRRRSVLVPDWSVARRLGCVLSSDGRMLSVQQIETGVEQRPLMYAKPVRSMAAGLIYSRPGDVILDLFGGGGATIIAAEMTGRRAYVMEIEPNRCDIMIRRWEEFTGRKAERIGPATGAEGTGQGGRC